jgi:hypothetical protein
MQFQFQSVSARARLASLGCPGDASSLRGCAALKLSLAKHDHERHQKSPKQRIFSVLSLHCRFTDALNRRKRVSR